MSIISNLDHILKRKCARKSTISDFSFSECGICYSYLYKEIPPECVCQNMSCSQIYHRDCLLQVLTLVSLERIYKSYLMLMIVAYFIIFYEENMWGHSRSLSLLQ
jgi:hypothetical protein